MSDTSISPMNMIDATSRPATFSRPELPQPGSCLSASRPKSSRRGGAVFPLVLGAIVALVALGYFLWTAYSGSSEGPTIEAVFKEVTRGEFVAKVLDQGEVQSAENVEIKCKVGSRNGNITVIDAVPEGTKVKGGDWLISLDKIAFEKEREQQLLAVSNAETSVIQSKASLEAAKAALKEYEQGTFVEQKKTIENEKFNAEQELEQAKAVLQHSINLQKKGFITKQQLKSDEIAVARAQNAVDLAAQKMYVLEEITREKELIQFESDIQSAQVQYDNAIESKKIEDRQLAEIEAQLEFCTINVPEGVEGEVVYHKEFDRRGGSEWILEPGATVREQQVLIKLPNPNKMEVKVLINEQAITSIKAGFPASISVDALSSLPLKGYVTKVNSYAEPSGFMGGSSVREYAIFVRIIDPPADLIPGMNASVTIQTEFQKGVLQAPLQCIYAANDRSYVLRKRG